MFLKFEEFLKENTNNSSEEETVSEALSPAEKKNKALSFFIKYGDSSDEYDWVEDDINNQFNVARIEMGYNFDQAEADDEAYNAFGKISNKDLDNLPKGWTWDEFEDSIYIWKS